MLPCRGVSAIGLSCNIHLFHIILLLLFYLFIHFPVAFVKSDLPNSFSGFSVKYVRGADPVIKLLDADGNVQEELSIQKWDTDTITDFLKEHLQ